MAQILTQTTQIVCLRLRRRAPTKKLCEIRVPFAPFALKSFVAFVKLVDKTFNFQLLNFNFQINSKP